MGARRRSMARLRRHPVGRLVPCTPDQSARACGLTQAAAVAGTVTIVDLSALAVFLGTQLLLFFTRRRVSAPAAPPVASPQP